MTGPGPPPVSHTVRRPQGPVKPGVVLVPGTMFHVRRFPKYLPGVAGSPPTEGSLFHRLLAPPQYNTGYTLLLLRLGPPQQHPITVDCWSLSYVNRKNFCLTLVQNMTYKLIVHSNAKGKLYCIKISTFNNWETFMFKVSIFQYKSV